MRGGAARRTMVSAGPLHHTNGERHDMITVIGLLIVAGLVGLLLLGRSLRTQVEALRAEVALARIEGVLSKDSPVP